MNREEYLAMMDHIKALVLEGTYKGMNQIETFEYVWSSIPKDDDGQPVMTQDQLAKIVSEEYYRANPSRWDEGGPRSEFLHYRRFDPIKGQRTRTIPFGGGVKARVVFPEGKSSRIQSLLFDRSQFSKKRAKAFLRKYPRLSAKGGNPGIDKVLPSATYDAVQRYIRAIHNSEKRRYASDYFSFLMGKLHESPSLYEYELGTMGRQAVRLRLYDLMGIGKSKNPPTEKLTKAHTKFNFKGPRKVSTQNLPINEHDQLFEVGGMPRIHYLSVKEGEDVEYEHKFKNDVRIYCSTNKKYLVVMRKDRKPFDVSDWFYD